MSHHSLLTFTPDIHLTVRHKESLDYTVYGFFSDPTNRNTAVLLQIAFLKCCPGLNPISEKNKKTCETVFI